jgi:hypothetical protein
VAVCHLEKDKLLIKNRVQLTPELQLPNIQHPAIMTIFSLHSASWGMPGVQNS